jgi:hypothetical protein
MEKPLLFISTLLISTFSFAQFENFEDWTQNSLLSLDHSETTVYILGMAGENIVSQVADAVKGGISF